MVHPGERALRKLPPGVHRRQQKHGRARLPRPRLRHRMRRWTRRCPRPRSSPRCGAWACWRTDAPAPPGRALGGGVSSDIWLVELAGGPVCVKRALSRLKVAADWQVPVERNRYEARWMRRANAAVPGSAPALLGEDAESGALAMQYLPPESYPLWKPRLYLGCTSASFAASVGYNLVAHPWCNRCRPDGCTRVSDRRDLPRDPHRALSARHRRAPSRPRSGAAGAGRGDGGDAAGAGAWRCQPEEHPLRPRPAGVPGRGMRLVGRPGLRPRVLPQPPAAEMPLDAARDRGPAGVLRGAGRRVSRAAWTGRRRRRWRSGRRGCCGGLLLARVDGKSPVEYITAEQDKDRVRRVARALLARPPTRLDEVAAAWRGELER